MDEVLRILRVVGALGLAGAVGGVVAALIQRGGTKDTATATREAARVARESAVAVAELNREAQRVLAVGASRRDWQRNLVQPQADDVLRRAELYGQIDEAARAGDGSRVKLLVDQLGPMVEFHVIPLLFQVPPHMGQVFDRVTEADSAGRAMAKAALQGPIGPAFEQP